MSDEKTVLVLFRGRRRPITFRCDEDPKTENDNLLGAAIDGFQDIISSNEGPSTSTSTNTFYLQRESEKWNGLIDVMGSVQENEMIYLCLQSEMTSTASQMSKASAKATVAAKKLGKPSQANAKVLASLFPGYSAGNKRKFDPHSESVVAEQHRQKKAAFKRKGRGKQVHVMIVEEKTLTIPKGFKKNRLKENGRAKTLEFFRYMDTTEVNDVLIKAFPRVLSTQFRFLKPTRYNVLAEADNQAMDGNDIFEVAKGGSLYLKAQSNTLMESSNHCKDDDGVSSDCDLPVAPIRKPTYSKQAIAAILQKSYDTVKKLRAHSEPGSFSNPVSLSDTESEELQTESGNVHTEHQENELQAWREVRMQQDIEYNTALEEDIAKQTAKEDEERKQQLHKQIKENVKLKFSTENNQGIKVGFKLPDGKIMHYVFKVTATVKDMYQFVIANEVPLPFTLHSLYPVTKLDLETGTNSSIECYHECIIHTTLDDGIVSIQTLQLLDDKVTNYTAEADLDIENDFEISTDDKEREVFMESINASSGPARIIDRTTIYEAVMKMYNQEEIALEYPLFIKFTGELGIDEGGVQRDMLTAFWDEAYTRLFEGSTTVIPMIHSQMDMSTFTTLGKVVSHGFLATGIIPDRIGLPSQLVALIGPDVKLLPTVLLNAFLDYISVAERELFKAAQEKTTFEPDFSSQILSVLSRFGCRVVPTPSSLIAITENAARFEFCLKPAAALATMYSGIPSCHRAYWDGKSADVLVKLHHRLTVTPSKVLAMLDVSSFISPVEERVYGFLISMVGNMTQRELKLFLRFVTGCSVCLSSKINVKFSDLTGVARRPTASTCDFTLVLPTSYLNDDDFYGEFKQIFDSTEREFAWRIDER